MEFCLHAGMALSGLVKCGYSCMQNPLPGLQQFHDKAVAAATSNLVISNLVIATSCWLFCNDAAQRMSSEGTLRLCSQH